MEMNTQERAMTDTFEVVARAMCALWGVDPDGPYYDEDPHGETRLQHYLKDAPALIAAFDAAGYALVPKMKALQVSKERVAR